MKHIRLPGYNAADLDRLSYSSGDIVSDTTNITVRYMDGVTPGGFKLATQDYVQTNAITSANLATNLTSALLPYAKTTDLAPYALTVDVNSAISAIPIYSLPTASTSILGGVKVDGTSITIDGNGVIRGSNQYTLPIATTGVIGGVRPDGTTITINPATGVISGANTYVLPTATTSVKGGVTIPSVATSGLNNTSGAITLAQATTTQLGGVKVDGSTITINPTTGVISGAQLYTLPTATTTVLGGVTIPAVANSGLTNTAGAIRLATATTNQLGGVKVDGVTITINGSGVIAANITGAIVFQGGWDASTNTPTLNNTSSAYNTNGFEFVTTKSGTVNFGAGNVAFAVGDNVIYDGTKWVKIPIGSSAGTTNSILTFDDSGTGGVASSTFNGSAILTVSYNTLGASPLAGSSSLTTVGTIGTGTWNGTIISPAYGGTGVNNATRTLTLTGGSYTLNQNINNGASPTFDGANFSGTAPSLTAGNATNAANATSAGKATNIAGGANLRIAYNTSADTTAFIAAPTVDSTYLKYTTGGGLAWGAVTLATAATNLAGGAVNRIHYQTAADTSGFIVAPTVSGTYLQWNGTSFVFSTVSGASGGTVTSITASSTAVNGLSLSGGTITGSGTIGITGTLSLISPPAIGSTTPNTGAFTILTVNSASTSAVTLSPTGSGTVTIGPTTAGTINNMSIGATTAGSGRFTTVTTTTASTTSTGGGNLYLNAGTSNRIDFNTNGVAAPTFNGISAGAKLILYPANATTSADYAIGIEGSTLWFGLPTTTEQFKWYGGTTNIMSLSGAGALSATSFAGAVNGTVGATTPNTGAFTTLSASSTVSGTGFSTYLASPPAIGGTAAAAGTFTTLTATDARDVIYSSGTTTGTITPNAANGNVQTITLTGSITLNALASPVSGQTITMIITQPASGGPYTLTSSMKFAGGFKTLSTGANAVDMLTISYIGTTYYASLVTGFA